MGFIIYNIIIGLVSIFLLNLNAEFVLNRLNKMNNKNNIKVNCVHKIIVLFCPIINILFLIFVLFIIYSDDKTFENFKKIFN